jgi:integrase
VTAATAPAQVCDADWPARWRKHLLDSIDPNWRPDEYDHSQLIFVPASQQAKARCVRSGCTQIAPRKALCRRCRREKWLTGIETEQFIQTPVAPDRAAWPTKCLVGCERSPLASGLCRAHNEYYRRTGDGDESHTSVLLWIERCTNLEVLPPRERCIVRGCCDERQYRNGLCSDHRHAGIDWINRWNKAGRQPNADFDLWLAREAEPFHQPSGLALSKLCAVPFGLLEGTAGLELIVALQQRDAEGVLNFVPDQLRHLYRDFRSCGVSTLVDRHALESTDLRRRGCYYRSLAYDLIDLVQIEHRKWSGIDDRDPRIIHFTDLDLTDSMRRGRRAVIDLRDLDNDWVVRTLLHWACHTRLSSTTMYRMVGVWRLVDQIVHERAKTPDQLGSEDMDVIVRAVRAKWPAFTEQGHRLPMLWRLIEYGHKTDDLADIWTAVSPRFGKNSATHRPHTQGADWKNPNPPANPDEPFRFVPQPIVDWMMDHLHLVGGDDDYWTMETRAMVFLQERCGRRPGETLHLRHDCLSYDSTGHPYLEWTRIKPPKRAGKRLPIHQETHDVIRQWQQVKSEHGISSDWLFPSRNWHKRDAPYHTDQLTRRIRDVVAAVQQNTPFPATVAGAEGNLILYDPTKIDAYALRHAFAQRYADAVDTEGRSTTPPDVLQELMDHKTFETTMTYYEVGAKRRKAVVAAITPRRLDILGNVVEVNRERDGFTRVPVSLGHCEEPQNVAMAGAGCMLSHSCESCPYFRVDPLEREGMVAKRFDLKVQLERATVINAPAHMLDHLKARIQHCDAIIAGIDDYLSDLPESERQAIAGALEAMADIRRRATTPRRIDLRAHLRGETHQ